MEAMASLQAQKQRMRERGQDTSRYTYNKEQENVHQDTVSVYCLTCVLEICISFDLFLLGLIRCRVDTRDSKTFQY